MGVLSLGAADIFGVPGYVIDTSSLVAAKEDYPREHFEGLWERLEESIDKGILISSVEVLEELEDVSKVFTNLDVDAVDLEEAGA